MKLYADHSADSGNFSWRATNKAGSDCRLPIYFELASACGLVLAQINNSYSHFLRLAITLEAPNTCTQN